MVHIHVISYDFYILLCLQSLFLLRDGIHSADYVVARCPSVRPSDRPSVIRQTPVLCRWTYPQTISWSGSHTIKFWFFLTKRYGNIVTGTPIMGASNELQGVWKINFWPISRFISEIIQDRAVSKRSNGTILLTLSDLAKYSTTWIICIARSLRQLSLYIYITTILIWYNYEIP